MAQNNVYSLNVVGYINLTMPPNAYSLLANQLTGSDKSIPAIFGTNYASGSSIFKWDSVAQQFASSDSFYDVAHTGGAPAGWYDTSLNISTTTLSPGEAFFFYNNGNTAASVTLVGQVTQGTTPVPVVAGYSFISLVPPVVADLSTNGPLALPIANGNSYFTFDTASGNYSSSVSYFDVAHTGGAPAGWYDTSLNQPGILPAVGQGFVFFNNSTSTTWTNTFSVQ